MEFSPWTEITRQHKPQKRLHCTNENLGRCKILKYLQNKENKKGNHLIGNERQTGNHFTVRCFFAKSLIKNL